MIAFTKGPFWGARCGNSARRVLIGEPGTSCSGGEASGIYQPMSSIFFLIACALFLAGCETMQAISDGEFAGKPKASNYSYSTPDRYRAGFKQVQESPQQDTSHR